MPRFRIIIERTNYLTQVVKAPTAKRAREWALCPPYDDVSLLDIEEDADDCKVQVLAICEVDQHTWDDGGYCVACFEPYPGGAQ